MHTYINKFRKKKEKVENIELEGIFYGLGGC